ncbi:ABC transporter substrate-binding protein [Halalkalibacterium ligniniphilum]|uniref:ABC transporter substrate-binding protein n=1 Tax=Halalkalibacterium ligniniphilum TaxID=1134413 RepID=UPI0003472894|nr:iron-siderophore ABC transporter substrate-binding protein [Halalkalibacterium ligniniphilum]
MSAITNSFERKYSISLLAIIFSFVLFLVGCGNQTGEEPVKDSEGEEQTEEIEETETQGEEQAAESENVRTIEHAMGTTEIEGTPERIVTLYQGATDVAVALGVKPVGVVESWVEQPIYEYLRDDLEGVQLLGLETQPNLEEIHKLEPDLIIVSKIRHEEIYDQLSEIAPTVVNEVIYDWKETVNLMGGALNKEDKAKQLLVDWDNRVADFKEKMDDRLPIEVTITNFRADHARIFYMGYAGLILHELGFTRPPGHDSEDWGIQLTSKESIPDMNADMIFNFNSGTETEAIQQTYEEWTNHPLWANLDAVKNDQVIQVNEVAWNSAGGYITANMMLDDLYEIFELEN